MAVDFEGVGSFLLELDASLDHLVVARRQLRRWLGAAMVDNQAADDLVAVASEFFLHVVVRTGGAGPARLQAERGPEGVRLSVTAATIDLRSPKIRSIDLPADPLLAGSLGRRLVDGSCDGVEISEAGGDLKVECWRSVRSA